METKLPLYLTLFAFIFSVGISDIAAQKADGISVSIHYQKLPKYRIPGKTYQVFLQANSALENQFGAQVSGKISLLGKEKVKNSADVTVLLCIENLVVKTNTIQTSVSGATGFVNVFMNQVIATSENSLKLIDNSGFELYTVKLPINGFSDNTVQSKSYPSEAEAKKNAKIDFEALTKSAVQKHIDLTVNFYGLKIEDELGEYRERVSFEVYSGKGEKMDYTELDSAVNRYKRAAAIYSKSGRSSITDNLFNQAIGAWEKAITEYVPGKDARVSDRNVGEFYHSIACACIWLDNRDKALEYEEKALKFDDNKRDKQKVKDFAIAYNSRLASIGKFTSELPAQKEAFFKAQIAKMRPNEMIISTLLNFNFSQLQGNIIYLNSYYPYYHPGARKIDQTNTYSDKSVETISYNFLSNGLLDEMNYQIVNSIKDDKSYSFKFNYAGNKLESILSNGRRRFEFRYNEKGQIIEITRLVNDQPQIIFNVSYTNPKTINFEIVGIKDGKKIPSTDKAFITLNEQNLIAERRIDLFHDKFLEYNNVGLPVKTQSYNPNTDAWVNIDYTYTLDEKNNWVKSDNGKNSSQTRIITY